MMPKQTSLIYVLNKEIRERGYISYQQMEQICRDNNRKPSNGERRLRPSESPTVEAIENERGAITGYKFRPEDVNKTPKFVAKPEEDVNKQEVPLFTGYHFKEKSQIVQDQDWTQ